MTEPRPDDAWLATELAMLAPALDRAVTPAPPAALLERTLHLATAELSRNPALLPGVASARRQLPVGFRRELARLLVSTLPALALGIGWAACCSLGRTGSGLAAAGLALRWSAPSCGRPLALGLVSASLPWSLIAGVAPLRGVES